MSYCVNCGVELGETEKTCPLCNTVVINPNQFINQGAKPPYPPESQKVDFAVNKRLTAGLISAFLALPASICLVCNYVIDRSLTWSLYVLGSLALVWLLIVPAYMIRRHKVILSVIISTVSICGFLRFIEAISPNKGWYLTLALPIVLVVAFICMIMAIIILYSSLRKLQTAAVFSLFLGGLMVAVEIATDVYHNKLLTGSSEFLLDWSLFLTIPCLILSVICLLTDRKRAVKEGLKKRFHV